MSDETGVLAAAEDYELRRLGEEHVDDYSLRHGGLYVEFSDVQWADYVWLLQANEQGSYVSVRHSTGEEGDVPPPINDRLETICKGYEPE